MIPIPRNTFYIKQTIEQGVNISPTFKDLPLDTETTFVLSEGSNENAFVLSGSVPDYPAYGAGELDGAYLSLYCNDITSIQARQNPKILGYRLRPDITINEGGYTLAHISGNTALSEVGHLLNCYYVNPVNTAAYMREEFEGSQWGFQQSITRAGGGTVTKFSGPYITLDDYQDMLIEDGAVFVQGGDDWQQHLASLWYGKEGSYVVTAATTDMGRADQGVNKGMTIEIFASPLSDFRILSGTDEPFSDWWRRWRAGDLDSYRGKTWPLSKYGKYIRYMYQESATNSFDNQAEASRTNTIFKDIYATRNYGNPYQSSDTDPLILSNVDLSVEKALNGGQSMRMYHNWGHYRGNPTIQEALDVSGNLNPQCAYASLYNIPMAPYPFDLGRATVSSDLTSANFQNHINPNSVLGEIRLPINVSKLGEMLHLNAVSGTSVDTLHSYFYSADIDPSGGGSTPYTKYEQTFLRSVVVTFSNYKPKLEHTTVDKFLDYGLNRFYTGEITENIVGGFVMARPNSQIQAIHQSTYQAGGMSVWPLPVGQIGQANDGVSTGLDTTPPLRGLLSGGLHKINGQTGGGATYDFNLNNCDTLLWSVTANAAASLDDDYNMRVVNLPMNVWNTCRIFIDPDQYNNFGSTTKRPYSVSGAQNPTMSSYKDTGAPMRVIFETPSETTQMVTMSGSTIISVSGALVNPSTTNLPFIDVFFPIGQSKVTRGVEGTNYPVGGASYTFRDKPEWYPQYMTIWVQNFPWVQGAENTDADEIGRTFFYGDDDLYPDGSVMEAEVFIDSVELFNFEPSVSNLTSGDAIGRVAFKPIDHLSPLHVQISGTSAQDYKNAWVASYPLAITGTVKTTASSAEVTIVGDGLLDTTMFDNCGEISIADTSGDATIPAGTKISTVNGLYSFTMDDDADATEATERVTLTSTGSTRPPVNRANLTNYNTGQFLLFGLDNKNYLPLGTSATQAAGYILCNNYTTANYEEAKSNPLLPRKTNHYSSLSDGGAIISWPNASWSPATNAFLPRYGSQLYGGGNYNIGTLASPTSASPGGNISGAVFQVQDAAAETANSISTTIGSANAFASNDGWRQKGFMYVSVSGAAGDNGVGYADWSKRENILTSVKITQIAPVVNTDKFDENNMTYNQLQVSDISSFNFLNEDETYIIYEMGAIDYETTGSKTGLKMDSTNRPNALKRILSFTEELKYADDGKTELITEPKLPNLWICPEKYWLTMMFDSPPTTINRNYTGFCTINETPTTADAAGLAALSGTTFNEYTYSYNEGAIATGGAAGVYYRTWNLNPSDSNQKTIINNLDYGFGVYDMELNPLGGNALEGNVEYQRFNYYDISQIVEAENLEPTDSFPILLYHGGDGGKNREMEFFSDDYTTDLTKVPLTYWRFKDEPPLINDFAVMPAVDVLGEDTDLYNLSSDSLNSVKFTWDEGNADDIWYRMLMVDTNTNILDKYHKCVLHIPLNETIADLSAKPEFTAYNPISGTSVALTENSVVRSVIEGQGGYAAYVSGGAADQITLTSATDWRGLQGLDEWTLVVHWTPAVASRGVEEYIIGQTDDFTTRTDNFSLRKGVNDNIIVAMDTCTLSGTSSIPCDGRTPVSIIITSNNAAQGFPRQLLYIDGVREDADNEFTVEFAGDNDFVIAPYHNPSNVGAQGMFEEVLIYNKSWDVVNSSKEYVYNASNLSEFAGTTSANASNYTQSARLFAMDYHNFRGSSKRHLGMSAQVGWRTVTA